jgi:hypothetical protein
MSKEFAVGFEKVMPASPQETWEAITTGTAGWLWPIEYEPHVGGAETGLAGGTVTAWEPTRHLATRIEGDDGWFNNLDYRLEPRDGGTLVRYEHTGVFLDNWDTEYEGCCQHTDFYSHTLSQYLAQFAGRRATYVSADGPEASQAAGSFATLKNALGLTDGTAVGDVVRFEVPGLDTVDGVVDYVTANFVGVRTADALYRFFGRDAFGYPVGVAQHAFGAVDAEKAGQAWRSWLDGLYA